MKISLFDRPHKQAPRIPLIPPPLTSVPARQELRHRVDHRVAQLLLQHPQVLLREGVLPHVRVHGGRHGHGLAHVPRPDDRRLVLFGFVVD